MPITRLPQVDKILRHERMVQMQQSLRRELLLELVREELERLRRGGTPESAAQLDAIVESVCRTARELQRPALSKVINGTGVVLNTNLGRAPLNTQALESLRELGGGYCNLEIDLDSGKRGRRSQRIEQLLKLLTGAEAAVVVNNNAAAVLLCVNALAKDKEVIVSRGELIEIGGSFRLPDVIEAAGGHLKEVGTTNRTRIGDFRKALSERTGLLVRCHRSNFAITGFTEEPSLEELCELSAETGIPLLEDLGSGVLYNLPAPGLSDEPTVAQVVAVGCDLVSFSGDKLLGGPQAGVIVGKKALVEKLSRHPLYRALRLDKLTLSLLERTLIYYLHPQPELFLPVLSMLKEPAADIAKRANNFCATLSGACRRVRCSTIITQAAAGGGSLPGQEIDSAGISVQIESMSAAKIAQWFRRNEPPVIGVVQGDRFILDFRTITNTDEAMLLNAIKQLDNLPA